MNFVTFNQDYSCLAVGTRSGYRIYNCDPFGRCYEHKGNEVAIIEMLFSTSLVAVILSPRQLRITNTKVGILSYLIPYLSRPPYPHLLLVMAANKPLFVRVFLQRQSTICELTFPTSVLAVRLNRKRLIVVLEEQIYLYDISNMKLLYIIETSPNPHGKQSVMQGLHCGFI